MAEVQQNTEVSLEDLLFGQNKNSPKIDYLLTQPEITDGNAKKILSAIQHLEIREIIDELEQQIQTGASVLYYTSLHNKCRLQAYLALDIDYQQALLFTDWSYYKGFFLYFCSLLERAFPDYRLDPIRPVGELRMQKIEDNICKLNQQKSSKTH